MVSEFVVLVKLWETSTGLGLSLGKFPPVKFKNPHHYTVQTDWTHRQFCTLQSPTPNDYYYCYWKYKFFELCVLVSEPEFGLSVSIRARKLYWKLPSFLKALKISSPNFKFKKIW